MRSDRDDAMGALTCKAAGVLANLLLSGRDVRTMLMNGVNNNVRRPVRHGA